MIFSTFLLRVNDKREAELEDFKDICKERTHYYEPDHGKFLYNFETEIVENRFFWLSCEYDDAKKFREYVINKDTGEYELNPRNRSQIELKQQFFACYDTKTHYLYATDMTKRSIIQAFLESKSRGKTFRINNIYVSVDEFCERIKSIRGFTFTQVNNIFSTSGDVFKQIGDLFGRDMPDKIKLNISYSDIPVHSGGKKLVERFHRVKVNLKMSLL